MTTRNEIAFDSREDALAMADKMLNNGYVILLSLEEDLTIINYEWSEYTDRNDVVFMSINDYYDRLDEWKKEDVEQ